MKAYLVGSLKNGEKVIYLAKHPMEALLFFGKENMDTTIAQEIAELSDYLANEKDYQKQYLKNEKKR